LPKRRTGSGWSTIRPSDSAVEAPYPQAGRRRLILPSPVGRIGTGVASPEPEQLAALDAHTVMMMGDNPALPRMPARPRLLDFFTHRFDDLTRRHLFTSAKRAREAGHNDTVVLACLLHDISNGALIRVDHGYWGAQLIAPYVSEEVAWAVRYHQPLRYFADESVGYAYPESYDRFFGPDYEPPAYVRQAHDEARKHPWYMTARLITLYDIYFFSPDDSIDPHEFDDLIARNFREPNEGLGFDDSPVAHMWRTMIWPNNFL
jgi:hypothetical protein